MDSTSIILLAAAVFFTVVWAFIGWLKFREHHHIIHNEPREKSHITNYFRRRRDSKRE